MNYSKVVSETTLILDVIVMQNNDYNLMGQQQIYIHNTSRHIYAHIEKDASHRIAENEYFT